MAVTLHQFAFSHFNEKARWALAYKQVPNTRQTYLPGPHMPALRKLSGQTATPVLALGEAIIIGSAAIIERLEQDYPQPPLYPADPDQRRAALTLQTQFDEGLGPAVRTLVFSVLVNEGGYLCRMFAGGKNLPTRLGYRVTFPLARPLIAKGNGVTPENLPRCRDLTAAALDEIAGQTSGTGYLIGDAFSVADLTAAALLAPLAELEHADMARPRPVPDRMTRLLTRWAGQAEQIFGWAAHELIGKNWGDWPFVHPDDLDRVRRVALELVEGRAQANVCRNRNLRKDGSVVHCDWFNSAIHDEHGRVVSMLSFVSDITDRVEAEAQVRELNAQLEQRVAQRTAELEAVNQKLKDEVRDREQIARVLFEQSHTMELMLENTAEGVIVADRDGNFLIWNAAARQIIGLDKEAVPAEEWARFYQCYRADGRTLFRTQDLPMVRAIKGESVDDEQMVIRREETGAERLLSINARPMVNEAGQVIGGVIVFRDNTERRRTETALRLVQTAIEQVGDSVVITDAMIDEPGPHILYVNPAFTRLTGYAEDEVISKTPRILQGPETDREVLDQVRAALRSGRPFHGQTINYRKDGSSFDIEWHIAPVRDEAGCLTNWVSIQRDITDKKLQEQLQRKHQAELAHVARLSTMGEMASGLAHELNQPLAAISNYISGCLRRFESGQVDQAQLVEALRRVGQQSQRAAQVIQRLREFVKKGEPRRGPVDVNEAVREAVGLIEHDARAARVALRLDLADGLPTVEGDAIQLEQVVLNLVRNALEAAEAGGPDSARAGVRIRSAYDRARKRVLVEVADRGIGASPADLEQVFNPFFSTKPDGMGMGLNISQSIAEAHQGRLWAEPNPDRGLTFSLALPASPAEA